MSPILVRPVREQLEHDRLIRFLAAKFKKRYDVTFNVGEERTAMVRVGQVVHYPDLVLASPEKGRKVLAVIEVETGESVNHLEAMAQWAPFSRQRAPFHLYVPTGSVDQARRLCAGNHAEVSEIWTYHSVIDEMRVALAYRAPQESARAHKPAPVTAAKAGSTRAAARPAAKARPALSKKPPIAKAKAAAKAKRPATPTRSAKSSARAVGSGGRRAPARGAATRTRRPSKRR